jgi:hypothetical protein
LEVLVSWYPWSVPDEAVSFVQEQFDHFQTPYPPNKALDYGIAMVISYVVENHYFAATPQEAIRRYKEPGLTEPEKYSILANMEILLKAKLGIRGIGLEQLHIMAWATLMFCWSDQAEELIQWWRKYGLGETIKDKMVTAPF